MLVDAAPEYPLPAQPRTSGTRLRLFDGFNLDHHGVTRILPAGGQRLLALLGMRGSMTRAAIVGTLWPEATERHAQGSLRTVLWQLGRADVRLIDTRRDQLALTAAIEVDVHAFTAWAKRLVGHVEGAGEEDLDLSLMMTGELLPGWYEDWVLFDRERLRQLRLHALEAAAWRLCRRRRYGSAIEAALAAIRCEPLRESAHSVLIEVHLCEDNVVEALRHYHAFRRLLATELGIEPSPRLAALVAARHSADHAHGVVDGSSFRSSLTGR